MSTRRVHLATGPVDIVVDNNSTGGDVIATAQSTLPDQPWHGKTLLSSGPRRFDFSDHVDDAANSGGCGSCGSCDLVLANFSVLAPPRRGLHIATEKSGITIPQIQQLLDFVFTMVNMVGACRWAETFGDERGRPLSFEAFNLYHANCWIIGPATAATDAHEACSYVELVADSPEAQRPLWFVSHAWLEPIHLFLTCLRRHSTLRELRVPAYWVCAYANNQHALEEAISNNPRKTSFYKAMKLCRGVLLVLDTQATPFTRIWCCFEESIAVEERDTNSLLLDVAATDLCHVAHVITDGLVGAETRVLPILGLLCKSRREQSFPMDLLQKGLSVDIAAAQASKEEDKTRILNSVRCPRARTWALDTPFPTQHPRYDAVNRALASHFALTSIQQSYRNGQQAPSTLWQALRSDAERRNIQVSLTGCHNFRDPDLRILIDNLPAKLQSLRLDLAYTGLERLDDLAGASFGNALQTLVIRFAGSLRSISGLSSLLRRSLRRLELWLSDLPDLEDVELGVSNKALLKLRLEELVLYVNGCPSVPRESKTALFAATRQLKQCLRCRPYMWVHIEDTNTWTLNLCLGKLKVGRSQSHLEIGSPSSPTPSAASLAEIPESQIDPFPCHCCTKFHGNSHGYCDAHRLARFYHNAFSRCHLVFQYAELLMIFFVQATADIESRGLLALIVISLYPVLWMSLVGSATSICVVLISLLFASVSYALLRFDRMHRATLELSLASEAICSQAIRPANLSHLSLVFGSSADDFPNTDLRQSETDLTSNFRQARIHFLSFQNALRRALSEGEVTNATAHAKIKRLADLTSQGDHDVLSCEIHCESLQQVQLVWFALSKRFQSEEEPWKIVALWDGFAQEEERRCSKIVMSMNGYLATVVLCVASLARLQSKLSELCLLADAFGLLEDAKPRRWMQRDGPRIAKGSSSGDLIASLPRSSQILGALLPVLLSLARFIAMITAAYFTCQYFFRYGPSSLNESIDQLGQHRFVKVAFGERFDGSWWDALCLSGPYAVLVVVFARDLLCFSAPTAQKRSRQLSQIVYDRYFGVEGTYYMFKVALLQLLTVLLQAFGKLHLLGGIALFAEQQRLSVAESLKVTFWLFWALLFCNSMYPNMLFIFPESMRCRYTCAMLDVFFDLGYVLSYLVMVVIGTTELHVNVSVWGNFGERSQLGFSNSISPKFAFPSEFLQYMAVYVSIAHVCCACRAVQRGQTPLEAARDTRPKVVWAHVRCPWVKRFLKYIYSPCLTALLVYLLICQDVYPGHRGDFTCFPCRCSAGRLQSCSLAAQLQQEQLVIAGVTSIEPQAFKPLGCRLSQLSLANNSITSLEPRTFEQLPCLQILDISRSKLSMLARDSFYGLEQLEVLSLHGNELHNISGDHLSHLPSLEKLLLGSKPGFDKETLTTYELEAGNLIKFLPPRLFEGNPHLNYFDVSGNNITKVDRDTFVGATNLRVLDLSQNSLRELPEGLFAGLSRLQQVWLYNNQLSALPEGLFAGLSRLQAVFLHNNQLSALPEGLFAGLSRLQQVWLYNNQLSALPEGLLAGLWRLQVLALHNNGLSALPDGLFAGLSSLQNVLLHNNQLSALPEGLFAGLSRLQAVLLNNNQLSALPEGLFAGIWSLQKVALNNNQLSALPEGLLAGLWWLQVLALHNNHLRALPEGLFAGLLSLQQVSLNNNQLSALPEGLFAGLSRLQKVWLENNHLSALPEGLFAGLWSLQQVSLKNNQLSALPKGLFAGLSSLQKMWLYNNQLSALPEGLFAGLSTLQLLALNNNQLSALPEGLFAGLSKLQEVWLNSNHLSALPDGLFAGLSSLQILALSNNHLSALPEGLFAGLSRLQAVFLHNNQLSALPEGLFAGLSRLQTVWLDHNYLSALPEGLFAGLSRLQAVSLDHNQLSALPDGLFSGLSSLQKVWLHNNSLKEGSG